MSVELIAEMATNHGGDLRLAKRFIEVFADAGANFVKGQFTRIAHLRRDDPQYDWFARSEFSDEQWMELRDWCETCGTKLLLTVYNVNDIAAVTAITPGTVKIGSGESRSVEFIRAVMMEFDRVIVGSGLGIGTARGQMRLRCEYLRSVTRYPAPAAFSTMLACHPYDGYDAGWSDHCVGIDVACSAILAGARIIEKHVYLDNQARSIKPWEASAIEFKSLRDFADDDPAARFVGRWQA